MNQKSKAQNCQLYTLNTSSQRCVRLSVEKPCGCQNRSKGTRAVHESSWANRGKLHLSFAHYHTSLSGLRAARAHTEGKSCERKSNCHAAKNISLRRKRERVEINQIKQKLFYSARGCGAGNEAAVRAESRFLAAATGERERCTRNAFLFFQHTHAKRVWSLGRRWGPPLLSWPKGTFRVLIFIPLDCG